MNFLKHISNFFAVDIPDESYQANIVSRVGIQDPITCITFDDIHSLLAVGCSTGSCYILGKLLDIEIVQLTRKSIISLLFTGERLIGCTPKEILLWNLNDLESSISVPFEEEILDVQLSPLSPWLIIAFQSGLVQLMDVHSSRMSDYSISLDLNMGFKLIGIRVNPVDMNQLLLAYENESIIWDFSLRRPIERFTYDKGKATGLCWRPDGVYLAISYDDGTIVYWTTKKKLFKASSKMKPVATIATGIQGVVSLVWTPEKGDCSRLVVGGDSQVLVYNIHSEKFEKAELESFETGFRIRSMVNVESLLLVWGCHLHELLVHDLKDTKGVPYLTPSLYFYSTGRAGCPVTSVNEDGFLFISAVGSSKPAPPLKGGKVYPTNTNRNYHLSVVAHDESIAFWHLSIPYPSLLYTAKWEGFRLSQSKIDFTADKSTLLINKDGLLVYVEFVKQVDVDALFDELDHTMAQLKQDTEDMRRPTKKFIEQTEAAFDEVEIKIEASPVDQDAERDTEPPLTADLETIELESQKIIEPSKDEPVESNVIKGIERLGTVDLTDTLHKRAGSTHSSTVPEELRQQYKRSTSLLNDISATVNNNPPLYIQSEHWHVPFQIEHNDVLTSFAFSASMGLIATSTPNDFFVTDIHSQSLLFHRQLSDITFTQSEVPSTISKVSFSYFMNDRPTPCIILCTNTFVFFFEIIKGKKITIKGKTGYEQNHQQSVLEFITLDDSYQRIDEFNVLGISGINYMLVTFNCISILNATAGGIQLINQRKFTDMIIKSGISLIKG